MSVHCILCYAPCPREERGATQHNLGCDDWTPRCV